MTVARTHSRMIKSVMDILCDLINQKKLKDEMSMTLARSHRSMIKSVMDILCDDMNHKILNT